jgi:hypothetical protein
VVQQACVTVSACDRSTETLGKGTLSQVAFKVNVMSMMLATFRGITPPQLCGPSAVAQLVAAASPQMCCRAVHTVRGT